MKVPWADFKDPTRETNPNEDLDSDDTESQRPHKKKQHIALSSEDDPYLILGLESKRWQATDEDIKKACTFVPRQLTLNSLFLDRKAVLKHHPDKKTGDEPDDADDAMFKSITRGIWAPFFALFYAFDPFSSQLMILLVTHGNGERLILRSLSTIPFRQPSWTAVQIFSPCTGLCFFVTPSEYLLALWDVTYQPILIDGQQSYQYRNWAT